MLSDEQEICRVGQIFGVKKAYELVNYIERPGVDNTFIEALEDGKHVAVFGASKTGKSSLIERQVGEQEKLYVQCSHQWKFKDFVEALLNAAYGRTEAEVISDDDNNRTVSPKTGITIESKFIEATLRKDFTQRGTNVVRKLDKSKYSLTNHGDIVRLFQDLGYAPSPSRQAMLYVVIDDFHRLDIATQEEVASVAKMLFDRANVVFICVGIWAEENKLSGLCSELMGRCVDVNCNIWPQESLVGVIEKGSEKLNVEFPAGFADTVAKTVYGSVFVVQEVCALACRQLGIKETLPDRLTVAKTINAELIVRQVTEKHCNFTDFHNKMLQLKGDDKEVLYVYAAMLSQPASAAPVITMNKLQEKIEGLFPETSFTRHFAHNACTRFTNLARERNFGKLFDFYRDQDGRYKLALVNPTIKFWLKGRRPQFVNDVRDHLEGSRGTGQPPLQFDI
jgi:hypothetical protein